MSYIQFNIPKFKLQQIILFRELCIVVLLFLRKVIVVMFVHRGVSPALISSRSCAGARRNTLEPAHLSS